MVEDKRDERNAKESIQLEGTFRSRKDDRFALVTNPRLRDDRNEGLSYDCVRLYVSIINNDALISPSVVACVLFPPGASLTMAAANVCVPYCLLTRNLLSAVNYKFITPRRPIHLKWLLTMNNIGTMLSLVTVDSSNYILSLCST